MKYWRVAISGLLIAGGITVAQRTNDFFISLVGSVVWAHVIVYALAIVLIFSAQMLFAFDLRRDWENEQFETLEEDTLNRIAKTMDTAIDSGIAQKVEATIGTKHYTIRIVREKHEDSE